LSRNKCKCSCLFLTLALGPTPLSFKGVNSERMASGARALIWVVAWSGGIVGWSDGQKGRGRFVRVEGKFVSKFVSVLGAEAGRPEVGLSESHFLHDCACRYSLCVSHRIAGCACQEVDPGFRTGIQKDANGLKSLHQAFFALKGFV